jgi:hypothetical protein
MKRVTCSCIVVGVILPLVASVVLSQAPPGPSDEWTQEDWGGAAPMPNRPMEMRGPFGPDVVPGPAQFQQRWEQMQYQIEQAQLEAQRSKEVNLRRMLGVNDEQWAQIKPRLDHIERLKAEINASIDPGSFGTGPDSELGAMNGGGWAGGFAFSSQSGPNGTRYQSWSSGPPSARTDSSGSVRSEILCRELYEMLQTSNAPIVQIRQRIAALRQTKDQARRQLAQERKDLSTMVNPRQEAALIVMGYLD